MGLLMLPYTNLHELNLDWIINAIRESGVLSVNGQTGVVVLYPEANIEFPDVPSDLSWSLTRKANGTKSGIKFNKAAPMQRVYSNSAFNVYDEGNPPPYPVSSVNGQTGSVTVPVPFDSLSGDLINFSTASPDHSWTLNRKTRDGDAGLTIDTTGDNPKLTLDFINNNETVDESIPVMLQGDIAYVDATVPLNTSDSYKIGTFASLGIPANAKILSVQCRNITNSICHVTGFGVYETDIYVGIAGSVAVADGIVRVTYMK